MKSSFLHKISRAETFEKEGKLLHALQVYKSLEPDEDHRKMVLYKTVGLYSRLNNIDKGYAELKSYSEAHPDDYELLIFFAEYCLENYMAEDAVDIISSIPLNRYPELYYLLGAANYSLNSYEIATLNFKEFLFSNPGSELLPDAYLHLGKCYLKLGNNEEALKNTLLALDFNRENGEAYTLLTIIYYRKEMYLHSLENVKKALSIVYPVENDLLLWKGRIHYHLAEYAEAEKELREYLKNDKPTSEIYSMLGYIYLERKKFSDSETFFSKSIRLDPENDQARKGLEISRQRKTSVL